MKVLGIDTSTPCASVGLADDGGVISEYLLNVPVTHSERLLAAIHFVLKEAGCAMEALDGWAISLGPGSFTGLRIGVSTVKGLAYATGKPVVGVPTLDGLAAQISPTPYLICPILDARKKEVYTAFYRYNQENLLVRLSDYRAIHPDDPDQRSKREDGLHWQWGQSVRRDSSKRPSFFRPVPASSDPSPSRVHGGQTGA